MEMDNVAARDAAGETVARELITYDATRELALDSRDESWSQRSQLFTVIGHGDGIGVLRSAADTLRLDRAVDQIILVPGSARDRLPTADQLKIGTEHVYTLNPHRDRNGDPNTIGLIMVGHGADIESASDASSRTTAPLIDTPTAIPDLSQLLAAHEYRPLEGRRGHIMTRDEGLAVYRAAQPLLSDALSGTYNTTVILQELGLVLRIGQPDTGIYDPRFGPEHRTLVDISRYVRNAPQLLKVITGLMPDGRVIDESAPILIERLARGNNLAETFSASRPEYDPVPSGADTADLRERPRAAARDAGGPSAAGATDTTGRRQRRHRGVVPEPYRLVHREVLSTALRPLRSPVR
jgi:hypothetical protein